MCALLPTPLNNGHYLKHWVINVEGNGYKKKNNSGLDHALFLFENIQ